MPIYYASLINSRQVVVLQGVYEQTKTVFKSQVIQLSNKIQAYKTTLAQIDPTLSIVYRNYGTISLAIVVSKDIDLQESGNFIDAFLPFIETNVMGKPGYTPPSSGNHLNSSSSTAQDDLDKLFSPMQASTAESTYRQFQPKCDKFVTAWNRNPENRSKIGQLQQSMEETKDVLMDNLNDTMRRGQLIE